MRAFQASFIDLLVECEAIRFGDFTLKSGRPSPYFINTAQFQSGDAIGRLGRAYAAKIRDVDMPCTLVFGPAYKGIPLAVTTVIALAIQGHQARYSFNRKEIKDHGEGGLFVGAQPGPGDRVVIVDDVITSGQSIRESLDLLHTVGAKPAGIVVAIDRQERGRGSLSTLDELRDDLGVPVYSIVTIRNIVAHLSGPSMAPDRRLSDERRRAIEAHLEQHG